NLGFTRFSVRGKQKVKNELAFALMAVNLRKNAVMDGKIVAEDEKNTKKVPSKFFIAWNLFNLLFLASCVPASFTVWFDMDMHISYFMLVIQVIFNIFGYAMALNDI
ncbi:hypothetical protein NSA56_09330, partial [Oceanobacillus caeni]|nr:hypothetical protein [Oceanobacillus caeni]